MGEERYIGADGLPIEVGQEVYNTNFWERAIVVGLYDGKVELEGETLGRIESRAEELEHGMPEKMREHREKYPYKQSNLSLFHGMLFDRFRDGFQEGMGAAERTCEWIWLEEWRDDEEGRECDAANWALDCGCWEWSDEELYDFDDIEAKPTCWDYCPRCGAKVVG